MPNSQQSITAQMVADATRAQQPIYLYSVYDSVAQCYGPVIEALNDAVAMRRYNQLIDEVKVGKADYSLVRLGCFSRNYLPGVGVLLDVDECDVSSASTSDDYYVDAAGMLRPIKEAQL